MYDAVTSPLSLSPCVAVTIRRPKPQHQLIDDDDDTVDPLAVVIGLSTTSEESLASKSTLTYDHPFHTLSFVELVDSSVVLYAVGRSPRRVYPPTTSRRLDCRNRVNQRPRRRVNNHRCSHLCGSAHRDCRPTTAPMPRQDVAVDDRCRRPVHSRCPRSPAQLNVTAS